jgi:hypothetical protein
MVQPLTNREAITVAPIRAMASFVTIGNELVPSFRATMPFPGERSPRRHRR